MFDCSKKMVAIQLSVMMVLIGCTSIAAEVDGNAAKARSAKRRVSAATAESTDVSKAKSKKLEKIDLVVLHQCKNGKVFLHSFDGKVYELADTKQNKDHIRSLHRMPEGTPLFFQAALVKKTKKGGLVNLFYPWGTSPNNKAQKRLAEKYREHIRKILASKQIF